MIPFLSIIAVGFFLGMRHATDPDHVIAVTTIVSQQNRLTRAALTGAFWGLGHSFTIFIIGTAIILFGLVIPARVALSMELCVGLMLVSLGMINIAKVFRSTQHSTPAGESHSATDQPIGRPLFIGVVHGLAGSAAVALLVLAAIRNPYLAAGYLLVFGLGTVAGMMLITLSIASAFSVLGRALRSGRLLLLSGFMSLVFGSVLIYRIATLLSL
jgi:high-affinity nickel-transport protein